MESSIMLHEPASCLLSKHGPCSITRCRCRPILRLDNMVALVRRRELVNVTGAHAVVVEARPLPKVAGYTVPRSFAVAFDSEDKCCRHLFDHTEVCRQGNEQLDDAFGGSAGSSDDARDHAGVDPDHRWWRFVWIAGLTIVVGSYTARSKG